MTDSVNCVAFFDPVSLLIAILGRTQPIRPTQRRGDTYRWTAPVVSVVSLVSSGFAAFLRGRLLLRRRRFLRGRRARLLRRGRFVRGADRRLRIVGGGRGA